jgi:hypothetical protein
MHMNLSEQVSDIDLSVVAEMLRKFESYLLHLQQRNEPLWLRDLSNIAVLIFLKHTMHAHKKFTSVGQALQVSESTNHSPSIVSLL